MRKVKVVSSASEAAVCARDFGGDVKTQAKPEAVLFLAVAATHERPQQPPRYDGGQRIAQERKVGNVQPPPV